MLKNDKRIILNFACATVGIIILSAVISFLIKPDIMAFINALDSNISGTSQDPLGKFFQYVINNGIKVPLQMLVLSLIPIPFIYFLPVVLTAVATGVIFYLPFTPELHDKMSFFSIFLGIFPHGTIEFFSFCIISAILYRFNRAIRSRLFKKVHTEMGFMQSIKKVAITYCFVAFPLLIVAAFVEAYITPWIQSIS